MHKQRLKAPTRMAATEVEVGKLYLAELSYGSWTLVKVLGAETQGWLRGRVHVRGFYTTALGRHRASVTVEAVKTGKHFDMLVTRCRFEEPWLFVDDRHGTLMAPPPGYIDGLIRAQMAENEALFARIRENLGMTDNLTRLKEEHVSQ